MIPILLQAHTRSLTKIIYNHDGDLLFSASKDDRPNMWRTVNGERVGSFIGHRGVVWSIDVTSDSLTLASASGDNTVRLWDVATGKCKATIECDTGVRAIAWGMGDNLFAYVTDATMGLPATIVVADARTHAKAGPISKIVIPTGGDIKKPTTVRWTDANEALLTGHDDGHIALWSTAKDGALLASQKAHDATVRDIQMSADKTYFITASKDTTAKLVETYNLKTIKTYNTERPINSAAISPLRPEVLIAGGQEALNVTTTSSKAGQFEARFFHSIFETEIGRVRGHFGPINTLAYNPTGRGYASGAEDGYVRLHAFDPDYFDFAFTDPNIEDPLL